jgi:hypothetical protein
VSDAQANVCLYAQILPRIRDRARELGYAIGLHGSMTRDLDLMAMPWTEHAADQAVLVDELCKAVGGFCPSIPLGHPIPASLKDKWSVKGAPEDKKGRKPHGRTAWNICFGGYPFVDLSIMPRAQDRASILGI